MLSLFALDFSIGREEFVGGEAYLVEQVTHVELAAAAADIDWQSKGFIRGPRTLSVTW